MKPRLYQREAVKSVFDNWKTNRSTMVVMPTGTGKTIVISAIIKNCFPKRVMFIAHREELIFQAQDKIRRMTGFSTAVEMGDMKADETSLFDVPQVVISTIQTQTTGGDGGGRMSKFSPDDFGYLVFDECHHSVSSSWRKAFDYYCQNKNLKVLGVTATPDRHDEEALGQIFDSIAYDYEILDAIHQGWLVPITQQMAHIESLDFSGVRTTAGDLNGKDLANVLEMEKNLHGIADATVSTVGNKRCLIFAASVVQSEMLCGIINRHKPNSATWVCGKTDKQIRRKVLIDFAEGRIQYLVNCGVFTEGFDDPGVEAIILARPTKSRSLYAQMIGRGLRPLPGLVDSFADDDSEGRRDAIKNSSKPDALILDFVGNSGRHKLISAVDILGGNYSEETVRDVIETAKHDGRPVRVDAMLEEEEEKKRKKREEEKLREAARKAKIIGKAKFTITNIDPFDAFQLTPANVFSKDSRKQLSEKQEAILLKQGIDPARMPYSQAKQILDEQFRRWNLGLCTLKMAALLKRYGYETKNMTMEEAGKIIDGLKKSGWKTAI